MYKEEELKIAENIRVNESKLTRRGKRAFLEDSPLDVSAR